MEAKDWLTLSLGGIGTLLGIINAVKTHSRDKIRLKVIPKVFMDAPAGRFVTHNALKHGDVWDGVCIEIANTGFLPVTLSQVGFLLDHGNRLLLLLQPEFILPLRLEARHSVTAFMKTPAPITEKSIVESLKGAKCAFADTACGRTFMGTSPVFKSLIRIGKANNSSK